MRGVEIDGTSGASSDDVEIVLAGSDPSAETWSVERVAALFDVSPSTTWRAVPGRTTFPWPQADGAEPRYVVKRGVGDVLSERWFDLRHGLGRRTPAGREADALAGLAADGIPVPRGVLHATSRRRGASLLVMEVLPHRSSVRQAISADPDPPARAAREAARVAALAARIHDAGWYHRDLYLQHVVVRDDDGELALLDLGRARRERSPRRRWFQKDLAALVASAPEAATFVPAMLDAYFDARGVPAADRGPWTRAVRRRVARIVRHVPKHADPATREGGAEERDVDRRFLR